MGALFSVAWVTNQESDTEKTSLKSFQPLSASRVFNCINKQVLYLQLQKKLKSRCSTCFFFYVDIIGKIYKKNLSKHWQTSRPSWVLLGPFCAFLDAPWVILGASWIILRILGPFLVLLERLSASWMLLWPFWLLLRPCPLLLRASFLAF